MGRTGLEGNKKELGKRIGAKTCTTRQEKVKRQATGARKYLQY